MGNTTMLTPSLVFIIGFTVAPVLFLASAYFIAGYTLWLGGYRKTPHALLIYAAGVLTFIPVVLLVDPIQMGQRVHHLDRCVRRAGRHVVAGAVLRSPSTQDGTTLTDSTQLPTVIAQMSL